MNRAIRILCLRLKKIIDNASFSHVLKEESKARALPAKHIGKN